MHRKRISIGLILEAAEYDIAGLLALVFIPLIETPSHQTIRFSAVVSSRGLLAVDFTAAGLLGIFTRFPFNRHSKLCQTIPRQMYIFSAKNKYFSMRLRTWVYWGLQKKDTRGYKISPDVVFGLRDRLPPFSVLRNLLKGLRPLLPFWVRHVFGLVLLDRHLRIKPSS